MTTPTSSPGRTIGGRYALLAAVGAGGMGTVWRAHDQVLRRDVAVKEVLLPPGVPRAERQLLCERTLREARAAASLNNASVVRIYDVVEEDDRPWIIMELVAARSLAEIINDGGPLPPRLVADVGLQVLGALEAAHAAGILHRDVKPGNILLSEDGRVTLTDFGVARTSGDSALTSTGLLLGSPSYIPPERARGLPAVPASDLWSLGATLYAAVEGHPPYDTGDPVGTLTAIVSDPTPPFQRAGPLRPVLTGLLEKEPELRWDVRRARDGCRDALGSSRADSTSPLGAGTTRALSSLAVGAPANPRPLWEPEPEADADPWRPARPAPVRPGHRRARPGRRGGGVRWALAVALVIVLAGLAVAGRFYFTQDRTVTTSPSPSRSAVGQPVTPAGYFRFEHPAGFSVAIPDGWTQEVVQPSGIIQFRDPQDAIGGGRFLRLYAAPANRTMQEYFATADRTNKVELPGYQLISIGGSTAGTRQSMDWEFTHRRPVDRHVIDRGFILDGTAYSFYLSTREDQFAASKHILDASTASFALSR